MSHIAELSVRLGRFAGGSSISTVHQKCVGDGVNSGEDEKDRVKSLSRPAARRIRR